MKNKIVILFLFSIVLALPILNIQAYDPFYPGSFSNPLQVQIMPDPLQQYQQTLRDQQLRIQQRDQENFQNQLLQQQRDLQNQLLQQRINSQSTQRKGTLCNGNYWNACPVGDNFVCPSTGSAYCETPKTADQQCSDQFGQNSVSWGGLACGCKDGYTKNNNGKCLPKTNESALPFGCTSTSGFNAINGTPCGNTKSTETNDQICANNYGVNSVWDNTFNDKGGLVCDCKTGYQFNQEQTRCISIPKVETKIMAPTTKKVLEETTDKEKVASTDTVNLASINSDAKVITSTEVVKPKGFWNKFWGWFGF